MAQLFDALNEMAEKVGMNKQFVEGMKLDDYHCMLGEMTLYAIRQMQERMDALERANSPRKGSVGNVPRGLI